MTANSNPISRVFATTFNTAIGSPPSWGNSSSDTPIVSVSTPKTPAQVLFILHSVSDVGCFFDTTPCLPTRSCTDNDAPMCCNCSRPDFSVAVLGHSINGRISSGSFVRPKPSRIYLPIRLATSFTRQNFKDDSISWKAPSKRTLTQGTFFICGKLSLLKEVYAES